MNIPTAFSQDNSTNKLYTLTGLLEAATQKTHAQCAVMGEDFSYTYSEFNELTSFFACRLQEAGVKEGDLVGMVLERGAEMVIGIFGILKAGAAYVPADPSFPETRIVSLYQDAGVRFVVTTSDLSSFLSGLGFQPIVPDLVPSHIPADTTLLPQISPSHLAYVLFTSGSTGTPKGVMVEHHSVVNLLQYIQNRYPLQSADAVLFKSPYTFDGSIWEIFGWLLMGGTLCVAKPGAEKDPVALVKTIRNFRIRFMFFVPTMLGAFLDYLQTAGIRDAVQCLKWVSVGGEVLPVPMVKKFYEIFDGDYTRLINVYGPTETTVYATTHLCIPGKNYEKLPIGEAVTGDYIYILDENLNPVPKGQEGEIYIGGEGVSRGYLNRNELTQTMYLDNPFDGGKMYKTGDVGLELEDGEFDFTGRKDFQVKLRGLRIEMGEVEHALMSLSGIKEGVVLFAKDRNGDDSLVAYFVIETDKPTEETRLVTSEEKDQMTSAMGLKLPSYMIPSEFIKVPVFPQTAHGKIDRKSLPDVKSLLRITEKEVYVPGDPTGKKVFALWSGILGHTNCGAHDDFFASGGHSLKAVQLTTSLLKEFGVQIPLWDFYDGMTLTQLTDRIKSEVGDKIPGNIKVQPLPGANIFPLLPVQKDLWIANEADPSGITRNIQMEFRLSGFIDRDRLTRALEKVLKCSPVFRSVFYLKEGKPVQEILRSIHPLEIPYDDFSDKTLEEQSKTYQTLTRTHGRIRFHTDRLPLYSFRLIRFSEQEHILLMSLHHILFDGWSLQLFINRLREAYAGKACTEETLHAGEYAHWYHSQNLDEEKKLDLSFWKKQLDGIPDRLRLPLKSESRHGFGHWEGSRHWWDLSPELSDSIEAMAGRNHTTPFAIFMAAYHIALSASSGQNDIVSGTPWAAREHPDTENMTGYFTSLLPIRSKIKKTQKAIDFIAHVSQTEMEAFRHTTVSLGDIIPVLGIKFSPGVHPVYQNVFVMQNWPVPEGQFDGFTLAQKEIGNQTCKLDLLLNAEKSEDHYVCWLEYDILLYDPEFISRLSESISTILAAFVTSPDSLLGDIMDNLHDQKTIATVKDKNLFTPFPSEKCLFQLFETQASQTPEMQASSDASASFNYSTLRQKMNETARYLFEKGVKRGSRVAVYMERNALLPAFLMGIQKAGAAYIPLDPVFPPDRIRMILDDSSPDCLLMSRSLLTGQESLHSRIFLTEDIGRNPGSAEPQFPEPDPQNPAYLIYTSGSTGKPKGVVIPHRAVVNFLCSMQRTPGIKTGETLLALTTITFDIAVLELFLPLISGAQTFIADHETAADPRLLAETIERIRPDVIQATPVTYQMLLMAGWAGFPTLRVLCGGEAFPSDLAAKLLQNCSEVWNMYGPTETTVWSTVHKVLPEDVLSPGYIQLGKPIANTQLYILNEESLPVAEGEEGELCIGGLGLALGYHNLPGLTLEKFFPDPFSGLPDARLYRTGDLVRMNPNKEYIYISRIDHQVKIRGFRIETGEIESAVRGAGLKDCTVIAREEYGGVKQLIAYIIPQDESEINHPQLRDTLRMHLPDYMMPAHFVVLKEFPLTPNGKIDRKALPAPAESTDNRKRNISLPSTPTEVALAEIWKNVLQHSQIGIDDEFFDLGGNSLLALSIIIEIEKKFGKRMPLAMIFQEGSIRKMSIAIDRESGSSSWSSLIKIKNGSGRPPLFLIHAAGLNLLLYNTVASFLHPDQPVYGLQAKGLNGTDEPLYSLEEMAEYYINEITTVEKEGPYLLAGFCMGGQIAFEMAIQLKKMGKKVAFVGLFETIISFLTINTMKEPAKSLKLLRIEGIRLAWTLIAALRQPPERRKQYFLNKWKVLRRLLKLEPKSATHTMEGKNGPSTLPAYTRKVRDANEKAIRSYIPAPCDIKVHLFKATIQEFYILEKETYGWKDFALKGVEIIELPSEHSLMFAPPNDKLFAVKLQESMDTSLKEAQNEN